MKTLTQSAPEMCTLGKNQVSSSFTLMSVCGEGVAEREGFYYRRYLQVPMNPTLPR